MELDARYFRSEPLKPSAFFDDDDDVSLKLIEESLRSPSIPLAQN